MPFDLVAHGQRLLAIAGLLTCVPYAQGAVFIGLGDLPGGESLSFANSLSANGRVVIGTSMSASGQEAFMWTPRAGMIGLGDLSGGRFESYAHDVSDDGHVIVGYGRSSYGVEAFRWSQESGMVGLGDLPGTADGSSRYASKAVGVSADGSVIVGRGYSSSGPEAFRWTTDEGMIGLGDLPGGDEFVSRARAVSGDGTVIVGRGRSDNGQEAMYWTAETGMVGMGDMYDGEYQSIAQGVSFDGSVIVGYGRTGAFEAFRWTAEEGMVGLGELSGGLSRSMAFDVSGDGGVIVGHSATAIGSEAFIWDEIHGLRNLQQALGSDYGLDLNGWVLDAAYGISRDGTAIVGSGINPLGEQEAWMVHFAPVPLPPAIWLLSSGFSLLWLLARKPREPDNTGLRAT